MDLSFFTSADVVNNAAAVPIIVALVQLFKMVDPEGKFSRFAPFISIGVGVLISFLTRTPEITTSSAILSGILYGLSASGLYSGIKATAHTIKGEDPNGVK